MLTELGNQLSNITFLVGDVNQSLAQRLPCAMKRHQYSSCDLGTSRDILAAEVSAISVETLSLGRETSSVKFLYDIATAQFRKRK